MICLFRTCWEIDMVYIFVEGPDDERYVARVISPLLCNTQIVRYASMPNSKVNNFLQTISQTPTWDYIFLGDADGKSIEERKRHLLSKYTKLSPEKTFIVQFEIESWYYAGATEEDCKKLKLKNFVFATDNLTKELLISKMLRPTEKKYILECLLDVYSLPYAITRNTSLGILSENINERTRSAV